jgi:hypothetical protein
MLPNPLGTKIKCGRIKVAKGDTEIALKRLEILNGLPLVELNQAIRDLSAQFLRRSNLPPKASEPGQFRAYVATRELAFR